MKITLKRVLLCSLCLVGSILFIVALATPFKAYYQPGLVKGEWLFTIKASFFNGISKQPFHELFVYNRTVVNEIGTGKQTLSDIEAGAKLDDNAIKVFSIIAIIAIVLDMLATIGAFFMKDQKSARKLLIPFKALSILAVLLTMMIPGSALSNSVYTNGQTYHICDAELGMTFGFFFFGVICFVAALISAGVVKDKVLVGKKD